MEIGNLMENRPEMLLGYVRDTNQSYGDKFEKFNSLIYQTFERVARIRFKSNFNESKQLPLAILGALIFMKNYKFVNEDFTGMQFLDDFKSKLKDLPINPQINLDKILDFLRMKITSTSIVREIFYNEKTMPIDICEIINAIAEHKGKGEVENYNEEQMKKISAFFGEKIYLINYDYNKGALTDVTLTFKNIYLLKAKMMYMILFKEQEIEFMEKGFMGHDELAGIFNIENKLEKAAPKSKSAIKSTSNLKLTTSDLKTSNISEPNSEVIASQGSPKKQASELTVSRIKQSALFPDEVTCTYCCKKISEFSAIFWNYAYYCFQCVLNPKKDISFIPSSLIQKFLKNQKIESKQYLLICSECKSDTVIANYRPWDKPKNYRCKVCMKDICVEHEKMIGECFCHCSKCDKRTITIPSIYLKYCLSCKTRFCEICNVKDKKECACICKDCGLNQKVDHEECKPKCHNCDAKDIAFIDCPCKRKLCSICFFNSMEPNSSICIPADVK